MSPKVRATPAFFGRFALEAGGLYVIQNGYLLLPVNFIHAYAPRWSVTKQLKKD
jgi:hypothetical protein